MRLIFDGHLDLALFALCHNRDQTESVPQINAREAHMTDALERGGATVSLPEMRRAGWRCVSHPYQRGRSVRCSLLRDTDG